MKLVKKIATLFLLTAMTVSITACSSGVNTSASAGQTWEDCTFTLDGTTYTLPHSFSTLLDDGWTIDMHSYGYADDYLLEDGYHTNTYAITLDHEIYDFHIQVGLENNGDEPAPFEECDIYSICVDTHWTEEGEDIPPLEFAGGATWGTTIEEFVAINGEPDDIDRYEDNGSTVYTYKGEHEGEYVNFTASFFDGRGLMRFYYNR